MFCCLLTGLAGYGVYKLLQPVKGLGITRPEVGAAIGTTAGNAAATPAAVAAVDASLLAIAETATAQVTCAVIVTAILCPILVTWLNRVEKKRHPERYAAKSEA